MEFLDEDIVRVGKEISEIEGDGNMLIVGVECNHEASERIANTLKELLGKSATKVVIARNQREAEEKNLMTLRRAFYPMALKLSSQEFGARKSLVLIEDFSVPVSKLPEAVKRVKETAEKYGFRVFIAGHVGDGNLHPVIWVSQKDGEMMKRAEQFYVEVMNIALELDGTISAEHGIGELKKAGLVLEMKYRKSEKALEIMRKIKDVFDPNNILNPGKVI